MITLLEKLEIIHVSHADSKEKLDQLRKMIRELTAWLRKRHFTDIELINEYFNEKDFEEELSTLPGKYSGPEGRLLIALYNDQPAGCVALRKIDAQTCEMKRMFVYEEFHGKGIGNLLAETIIYEARAIGYSSMKLDTSFRQIEAQKLYQKLGFKRIEPYYTIPLKFKSWLIFMELEL